MDENERNPFGFLSGLGDAAQPMTPYQSPDLAARAPAFGGYGYQAPSMNMVMAPNQMPRMEMNPESINDPSVAAALQILNQPMMIGQMPNMMGSGTGYQEQYGLLPSMAAAPMQRQAMSQTPSQSLLEMMGMVAGGGNDYEFQGGMPNRAGVPVENRMGMSPDRGPIDAGSYDYSGLNDAFGPGHSDYGDVGYDN